MTDSCFGDLVRQHAHQVQAERVRRGQLVVGVLQVAVAAEETSVELADRARVRCAIGEFCGGFSSLANVEDLPVDIRQRASVEHHQLLPMGLDQLIPGGAAVHEFLGIAADIASVVAAVVAITASIARAFQARPDRKKGAGRDEN